MNCDDVSELLPWLLNGSLESGEKDEVRRHLATCERCRAALGETREAWTTFDQHLPSEALVALAWGETPSGVDAAVAARHLESCPQCAAELELARMSRQLEKDEKIAVFPAPSPRLGRDSTAVRSGSRAGRAAALAAGLAAVVGWTGWLYESQQAGDMAAQLARRPAAQAAPQTAPPPLAAGGIPPSPRRSRSSSGRRRRSRRGPASSSSRPPSRSPSSPARPRPPASPRSTSGRGW